MERSYLVTFDSPDGEEHAEFQLDAANEAEALCEARKLLAEEGEDPTYHLSNVVLA